MKGWNDRLEMACIELRNVIERLNHWEYHGKCEAEFQTGGFVLFMLSRDQFKPPSNTFGSLL